MESRPVFYCETRFGAEILKPGIVFTKEGVGHEEKSSNKKVIIGAAALVLVCVALLLVYKNFMPKGTEGAKTITVKVVHGDSSEKDYEYKTDEAYLGAVIQDNKLVEGEEGEFGLFMTSVDGEKADESKQQWWCLTKGGEQVNTSADQTPIEDGDIFELTLTEGY